MKRMISLLLVAVMLLGLLAGCRAGEGLPLSAEKDLEIRQAYAERRGSWYNADELTLRIVWQRDDIYALYVDGPFGFMDAIEIITIEGLKFFFPDSQPLYIYVDGEFYALREAYENGVLTEEDLKSLQKDYVYINLPPESDFWDPSTDKEAWVNNG